MSKKRRLRGSSGRKRDAKSSRYFFDEQAADDACEFIETLCKHWKGEWAGQPFVLQPWQRQIVRDVFGWKRRSDGTRRYRRVSIWVPKKNGKTFLAAAIALLLLFADGEPGAEVYSAAADKPQAKLVFEDAKQIIRQTRALARRCKVHRDTISFPATSSKYQALSAEAFTKHGYNVHGLIFDELHAQPNRELWETLVRGVAARRQPLVVSISTAGVYDPESIGWEEYDYARKVRDGVIEDDETYVVIYEASKDDDWTSPETWRKANPSLGVTLKEEFLAAECKKALEVPAKQEAFKRLHLNIWTSAAEAVIPAEQWNACDLPLIQKPGDTCFVGMDLSTKQDMTAVVAVFPHEDRTFSLLARFFLPRENIVELARRARAPYLQWAQDGYLELTDGNAIDYEAVRKHLLRLRDSYRVKQVAFDPWNATQIATQLQDQDGFEMVEVRQGAKSLSEPIKTFVALVADGRIRHGANPILRWMVSNFQVRKDPNDNWAPKKGRGTGKIDGVVATVMAFNRVLVDVAAKGSVYERRGARTV